MTKWNVNDDNGDVTVVGGHGQRTSSPCRCWRLIAMATAAMLPTLGPRRPGNVVKASVTRPALPTCGPPRAYPSYDTSGSLLWSDLNPDLFPRRLGWNKRTQITSFSYEPPHPPLPARTLYNTPRPYLPFDLKSTVWNADHHLVFDDLVEVRQQTTFRRTWGPGP